MMSRRHTNRVSKILVSDIAVVFMLTDKNDIGALSKPKNLRLTVMATGINTHEIANKCYPNFLMFK